MYCHLALLFSQLWNFFLGGIYYQVIISYFVCIYTLCNSSCYFVNVYTLAPTSHITDVYENCVVVLQKNQSLGIFKSSTQNFLGSILFEITKSILSLCVWVTSYGNSRKVHAHINATVIHTSIDLVLKAYA